MLLGLNGWPRNPVEFNGSRHGFPLMVGGLSGISQERSTHVAEHDARA
jgi:hypothetical protein